MEPSLKLPFSEDSEKGLISSLLRGGDKVSVEISALPKEAFYIPAHQLIWAALRDLLLEKKPLDYIAVKDRMSALKQLEEIGGPEGLSELYDFVPTWQNYKFYADIVQDHYRVRKAMLGLRDIMQHLQHGTIEGWPQLKPALENCLLKLVSDDDQADEVDAKEMTLVWMEDLALRKERLLREGIGFGIPALDESLGQQQPGELIVIGAASSVGKSMLAYQGIIHNATVRKLSTGLISLEMGQLQTWDRFASHAGKISMSHFRDGEFTEADIEKLHKIEQKLMSAPIHFCRGRLDISGIASWARRAKARHGIRLLVVDYLQRVGVGPEMLKRSRQEQVAYISNQLKDLALELGIVIWCPVQLNKEGEVRESASILFDSDVAFRIILNEDSYTSATIVFDKVRQGQRATSLPIEIAGWFQTISGKKLDDVMNPP
jgi:replicative DNA helicase